MPEQRPAEGADQGPPAEQPGRSLSWGRRVFRAVAWVLVLLLVAGLLFLARPAYLWTRAWLNDRPARDDLPAGDVDDASRLNQSHVAEVWSMPAESSAAESQLKDLLRRASRDGQRVSIAGARHSMGGHTIYKDGIVVDMTPFRRMELDADRRILHVGAGALV